MAKKITEVAQADFIKDEASLLMTQAENGVEKLERGPLTDVRAYMTQNMLGIDENGLFYIEVPDELEG